MKNIIAINGYHRSGKDTVAKTIQYLDYKRLCKEHNTVEYYDIEPFIKNDDFGNGYLQGHENSIIKKIAFANYPKDIFCHFIGDNLLLKEDTKHIHRSKFIEFTESLKVIFGKQVWCQKLNLVSRNNIVISDLRFEEEYSFLENSCKDLDYKLYFIKVYNENTFPFNDREKELDDKHFDYKIYNHGSLEYLFNQVKSIYQQISL